MLRLLLGPLPDRPGHSRVRQRQRGGSKRRLSTWGDRVHGDAPGRHGEGRPGRVACQARRHDAGGSSVRDDRGAAWPPVPGAVAFPWRQGHRHHHGCAGCVEPQARAGGGGCIRGSCPAHPCVHCLWHGSVRFAAGRGRIPWRGPDVRVGRGRCWAVGIVRSPIQHC